MTILQIWSKADNMDVRRCHLQEITTLYCCKDTREDRAGSANQRSTSFRSM